jgi:predicted dehydrogenase
MNQRSGVFSLETGGEAHMDLTRRGFMAAAGASVLAASAGGAADVVRIGMVGVGNRGSFLLQTLLQLEGVQVRAVCDVDERRALAARDIAAKAGGSPEMYTNGDHDYERLAARDDVDVVVIATPWDSHASIAIAAMRAGKAVGVEVPAAITLDECRELVRVSRETGRPCMMLENVCYFEEALAILRMARENLFGELLHCEAGYQHDCRSLTADDAGRLTWRGRFMAERNGNQYPTHPIGPIAQWLGINRGDRFTQISSVSTASRGMRKYMAEKFGPEHELARREYAQGDVNTTILRTAKGRTVVLYYDLSTHRPYDLIFRVQGTDGICIAAHDKQGEEWAAFQPLMKQYAHPTWVRHEQRAKESGGHGGADYITLYEFVQALKKGTPMPQDVGDAATWSAIVPLSIQSVAEGGRWLDFPDFTDGEWEKTPA